MWVLFSVLAALFWAVANIIDKHIMEKLVKKPVIPTIIFGLIGLLAFILVLLFKGFQDLSYLNITWALLTGFLYAFGTFAYFRAIRLEEISRVIPLLYLIPLFTLVIAALFLGEIFTPTNYLGILLLVAGAVMVSSKRISLKLSRGFWFAILAAFIFSVADVLTKYLLNFADFWTVFSYERLGTFIALMPLLCLNFSYMMSLGKKPALVMSVNESLSLLGHLFFVAAASFGFVTLVNALASVQPFFVLLFAVVLSIFYPRILKEEIGRSIVAVKLLAISLMFIGVILVT